MNKIVFDTSSVIKELPSQISMEIKRCAGGIKAVIVGADGISEFSENLIAVKCHGTKIYISGEKIKMNVLENKTMEIQGRVGEIKLGYGKN